MLGRIFSLLQLGLLRLALLGGLAAFCSDVQAGFLPPELSEASTSSVAAGSTTPQGDDDASDTPGVTALLPEALAGMTGQSTMSLTVIGGVASVCSAWILPIPRSGGRLWQCSRRVSCALGFQLEILRPPRA
jgi:hypothetical protein